ncbi:MAG: VWA domain-containing protein [Woronichinia naegeliana WA131]|jgi:Ca-activated chloride channel family protein|uniref:VWA domain-containing protein n=1 Tax=Woronichinia naegeliana WA131 TaxID=2824559 RepID=A0A977PWQ0_9CYAN|nr:MAG: VWA domain-containing protein [Woronichinia naegeliana WA131]
MKVNVKAALSDAHLDASQSSSQRQLCLSLSALQEGLEHSLPLNLCLVLDHSGSMNGKPLTTVKEAALGLIDNLQASDRLSVIAFDHKAKVIVPNQAVTDGAAIAKNIQSLKALGGTAIDEGMKLGIQEAGQSKQDRVSQIFLLTDGENEHGDNERCLKLAQVAADYNITINSLGFGAHWNQDILEAIADTANGSLSYIERPEQALETFSQLLSRMQTVGLTNPYLRLEFVPQVRLAELKPIAQVEPETVELTVQAESNGYEVRLGDLMTEQARVILANLYINQLPPGEQVIGSVQVRYDDPSQGATGLLSEKIPLTVTVQTLYQAQPNDQAQKAILTLAKYRQTQIAETKLKQGDRAGAATMLQTAAKTALQLGDQSGATVLQTNATRLQSGEELSEAERKKTRMVSKTTLQSD